jgi:hypothetical protein
MPQRAYGQLTYGDDTWGLGYTLGAPECLVEVQKADHSWADVTCDVRSINTSRGRPDNLADVSAGTATIVLANFADLYSPWNDSSIWASNGRYQTDVPLRISMVFGDGTSTRIFTGTTDSVNDSWPNAGLDAQVTVQATDGFKLLTRANGLPLAVPVGEGEKTGARIQRWLGLTNWTTGTNMDPGAATVHATALDSSALEGINQTAFNEGGFVFCGVDGDLIFHDRDSIDTYDRMINVQARFVDQHPDGSDATPWACYSDIVAAADETLLYNQAALAATGSVPQTASDATSVAWYGPRPFNDSHNIILADDNQVLTLAQLMVARFSDNEKRIDRIVIHPSQTADGDAWWIAANLRLIDRVYIERHMPGGHLLTDHLLIQGVSHQITATGTRTPIDWTITYATASALPIGSHWDTPADSANGWDLSEFGV